VTTDHRYWVHVPAQYTESEAAALMVFQDGWLYLDPEGEIRAGVVFDDLIERGEMPVTIGVFVDPAQDRNLEYDAADRGAAGEAPADLPARGDARPRLGPGPKLVRRQPARRAALADRGYDFRLTIGDGGHDLRHTGDVLPDALRWLWRR